jgi:hypothetical protein
VQRRVVAVAALAPLGLLTGCTTAVASATPQTRSTTAVASATASGSAIAGCKAVASDFNGDGYADVAIGEPENPITGGGVQIDYGSATGINATKSHFLSQATPGVPGDPAAEGVFGRTLVTGYFNDDCYADLAIGDPGDPGAGNVSEDSRGSVTVLYGSKNGLTTNYAHRFLGQATTDTSTNTGFGGSLASGDFNHDGRDDLAVGGEHNGLGAVAVLYGGATAIAAPSTWLSVSGGGDALTAGDFNGDGYADLAAGTANSTVNGEVSAGSVTVFDGSAKGITTTGSRRLTQDTAGIPGTSQAHAFFGVSLAAGDVNGDGLADLIVGISGQTLGTIKQAGDIAYIPGTRNGLTGSGAMRFSQSTAGIPGDAQFLDSAGTTVAVGDLNGDGYPDIAFGIPHDEVLGGPPVGSVIVLRGTKSGPTATGAVQLSENTAGIPGGAPALAQFGEGLHTAYIHGGKRADLVVGAFMQSVSGQAQGYAVVIPGIAGTGPTGTGAKAIGLAADGPEAVFITYFGYAFG